MKKTLFLLLVLASSGAYAGSDKVTVCHVPPGNPDNPRTISVGEAAVAAHLAHGDALDACVTECVPEEQAETACADDLDNDCDGSIDAADADCGFCGDGVLQEGEECDDGNTNPFDGCDECILVDTTPD